MQLERTDLHAAIQLRFPNNLTGDITPQLLREGLDELVDSLFVIATDTGAVPNVPLYKAGTTYVKGFTVRWTLGTREAFYAAQFAGKLPAPIGPGDLNWKEVAPPTSATALWQAVTLTQAQGIEGAGVQAGRLYQIDMGPNAGGATQLVYLMGLDQFFDVTRGVLEVNGVRTAVQNVNLGAGTWQLASNPTLNAYTKSETDNLLSLKVSATASITASGTTMQAANPTLAQIAAGVGGTVILRGPQPAVQFTRNQTLDGNGAQFGSKELQVGTFPAIANAHVATLVGFSSAGRVVTVTQNGGTANHLIFRDISLEGVAYMEFYGLGGPTGSNIVDTIELLRVYGRKTAVFPAIAGLSTAMIVLQSRSDFNQRQYNFLVRDCDLQNDVGPIFGGGVTRGSKFRLQGSTRVAPGTGFMVQNCFSFDGGNLVPLTDSEVLVDERGGIAALTANDIANLIDHTNSNVTVAVVAGKLVLTAAAGSGNTGGNTGGNATVPAYDGPLQFRPSQAGTSYFASFLSTSRFTLNALQNAPAGVTATARLWDGAYLPFADFNAAIAALPEVEITSGIKFSIMLAVASATLLSCDVPFTYLAPQPLVAGAPIVVVPQARDYHDNLFSAEYTDYVELDATASFQVTTDATSVDVPQYEKVISSYANSGVAVLVNGVVVTAARPTQANVIETKNVLLAGTGSKKVEFFTGTQQRFFDNGSRFGNFIGKAGLTFNGATFVNITRPARKKNRAIIISDSILSGIVNDDQANLNAYTPATESAITQLRKLLPDWEIYLLGYGNAQWVQSLGNPAESAPAIARIVDVLAGADKAVVYSQRGINDYGQGNRDPLNTGDVAGRFFDGIHTRNNRVKFAAQSLFHSAYDNTAGGAGYTAMDFSTAYLTRLTANRSYIHPVDANTIATLSLLGPDGLHYKRSAQATMAANLAALFTSL